MHAKEGRSCNFFCRLLYLELIPARRDEQALKILSAGMTKQLTLTGYVLQESSQFRPGYFIYNDPSNNYEHFIERYYRRNRQSGKEKQAVLREAQVEWKKLKVNPAELRQYFELRSEEQLITSLQAPQLTPKQVRNFGFTVCNPSETETVSDKCVLLDEASSSSS